MKLIGGIISWLGGMALLVSLLFYLMSLKNQADLFIWSFIGLIGGGFGITLLIIGGTMYQVGKTQDRSHEIN